MSLCLQLFQHAAQHLHTGDHQQTAMVGHAQFPGNTCSLNLRLGQQFMAIQLVETLLEAALVLEPPPQPASRAALMAQATPSEIHFLPVIVHFLLLEIKQCSYSGW